MVKYVLRLVAIIACLILLTRFVDAQVISVDINEYGVGFVSISVELNEGLQSIRLPVEPVAASIVALANGEAVPVIYENKILYLLLEKSSVVEVSYIANVSFVGNAFHLVIDTDDNLTLKIPSLSVILLTLPKEILSFKEENKTLTLVVRGPQEIIYTLRVPSITQTPTNTTAPPTTTPTQPQPDYTIPLITAISVITIASTTTYVLMRRKGPKDIVRLLDDVDKDIIRELRVRGGSALQSELQDSINVPKTTLWRHVKRLEKLGVVRVEKVGLQNRVVLVRDVKV